MKRESLPLDTLKMCERLITEVSEALLEAEDLGRDHVLIDVAKVTSKDPTDLVIFLKSVLRVAGFEVGSEDEKPAVIYVYRHPEYRGSGVVLGGVASKKVLN